MVQILPTPLTGPDTHRNMHRAGGDLMHRDERSRTLLHHAVSTGSKEVVRYLLEHGELEPPGPRGGCWASLTSSPLPFSSAH